jgi:GAF domain-containing protein/HAMP domain-containing protein
MAERAGIRSNPIVNLLVPRNMSAAFIGILLPFLILPLLLGYLGYSQARNSLVQTAGSDLKGIYQGLNPKVSQWQTNGLTQIQTISSTAEVVQAAGDLKSTTSSGSSITSFFDAVYKVQPKGSVFSEFVVVDSTTNGIIASTNAAWINQSLSGENALSTVKDWTLPFSVVLPSNGILSPSQLAVLAGSPLQVGANPTGLVLVGVLKIQDLTAILNNPLNNRNADLILLTLNDSTFTQMNPSQDTLTNIQVIPSSSQVPTNTGAVSEYTDIAGRPVIGYSQTLSLYNISGTSSTTASALKILIERNQSSAFAPLNALSTIIVLILIAILLAMAVAVAQAVFFIVRPTTNLAAAVNRFAAGHTEEQIPVYGTSEFVSLATSLNRLISSLREVTQLIGTGSQVSTRKVVVSAELIQSLSGVSTLDETLRIVVNLVKDRLGFEFSAIYLVDEAGQFAVLRDATGAVGEKLKAQNNRFPLGSYSIIGSVAQAGRSHLAANVSEDPMYIRNDLLPETRSEVAVPIRIGKRTIGVLDVHSISSNGFSSEDVDLLQSISDQTGSAVQNAQNLEAARVSQEVSQQLFRIGRLISMATNPEEIYKAVIDGLKGTPYIVTILQSGTTTLPIAGFYDPVNPQAEQAPVAEINETPDTFSHLIPSTAPVVAKLEGGLVRLPSGIRQYLETVGGKVVAFLPLRQGDRMLGALMLASRDENAITPNNIRPLTPIAESIISALERLDLLHTTTERLNELATLNRISQSISQALDIQGLFEIVHEQIRSAMGDLDVIISLYEPGRDLLTFPYAFLHGESATLDPMPLGESLFSLVVRNAQPLMLTENIEERASALGVRLSSPIPKAWMGIPLVSANQVVGVLVLQDSGQEAELSEEELALMKTGMYRAGKSHPETRFNENNLRLMTTIATQIASTIRTSTLLSDSERKAVQLQTAAEIARETIGLLDLDRLLSHSINLIRERFGFYHSSVFLMDEERKFALLRESTGEAGRQMKARGHKLGVGSQSIVGWVTQNARPRVSDDVTADPMHQANPLLPATRAELGIPLRIGETVIGALDVQSTTPYAFTADDITILQVIADQIAIAVENARLFSTTRDYLARHRSLYQVTTAAASSTTLDNALFSAAQGLRVTMNGARVAIFLLSPEQDALVVRAHSGFNSREVESMRVPFGQGVQGWVAVNKQPSLVANTATDSRYLMIDSDVQSELVVPLIHRDELLGVLDIQSQHVAAFSEDDVTLLGTVAGSLAAIMSSTVLFEQVTQERERLRHLYEEAIGMAGPPAGDMDTLLRSALERVRSVSGADCVSIAFPSGPEEVRVEMCTCEPNLKHLTGLVAHYGQDVIGEALSTNLAVKYTPASTGTLSRSLAQAGIRTALALPLQWTGRTIGGLLLSRMSSERLFSTEESQLANLLALQVAATIESARLFDQTRRAAEREHLLFEITSRIRRSVDMQGILTTTASELSRALGARRASIKIGLTETVNPEAGNNGGENPEQS